MIKFDNTLEQIFQRDFENFWRKSSSNTRAAVSIQGKGDRSGNLDSALTCVIPYWGKFFSKLKNCEEKPVRDLSSQFGPNQEVCAWRVWKLVPIKIMTYWGRIFPSSKSWKNLFRYSILGQNFSIFAKLEKFVVTSYARAIFPCLEKTIRPKSCWTGPREGVRLKSCWNGLRGGVSPNICWTGSHGGVRPNIYWNGPCGWVRPNDDRNGPLGCIRPNPLMFWVCN